MADIKGIKMNGTTIKEFSDTGGVHLYLCGKI